MQSMQSSPHLTMSDPGIWIANVANWRCMRGVMKKEPAVGFMHATYWTLFTSFIRIFCLSYLHRTSGAFKLN
jgi:hypothetical protein